MQKHSEAIKSEYIDSRHDRYKNEIPTAAKPKPVIDPKFKQAISKYIKNDNQVLAV